MAKIVLDAGHGFNTAGKRSPDGEREWSFNDAVVRAVIAKLADYQNVEILRVDDTTGKTDVSLYARTSRANTWKADVYISVHHNANTAKWGSWGGVETYTFPTASKGARDIASTIHSRIVGAMCLADRGLKSANFQVLRETNMPSILTEGGFMDSTKDIVAMRNPSIMKAQGEAIAVGLAEHFGLKLKNDNTVADSEGGTRMFKPSSATLNDAYAKFLQDAIAGGHLNAKWLADFKAGKLTLDDALALYVIDSQRK